jgi:hypothetical protein
MREREREGERGRERDRETVELGALRSRDRVQIETWEQEGSE